MLFFTIVDLPVIVWFWCCCVVVVLILGVVLRLCSLLDACGAVLDESCLIWILLVYLLFRLSLRYCVVFVCRLAVLSLACDLLLVLVCLFACFCFMGLIIVLV